MKSIFFSLMLTLFAAHTAHADDLRIDCTQATKGTVTIQVQGKTISNEEAVKKAYTCLAGLHAKIQDAEKQALAAIEKEFSDEEWFQTCKKAEARFIETKSWNSGRMSVDGESGSEAQFLVQQPITCGPVGTGMYEGISGNSWTILDLTEGTKYDTETEDESLTKQNFTVKFKAVAKI